MRKESEKTIAKDVEAVVTSYNQGTMILEAISSLCMQTTPPAKIILIDDGSTDESSLHILKELKTKSAFSVPITVVQQSNGGVSAARNAGISRTQTPMVLVLDGDDKLEPGYLEHVRSLLLQDASMVAASSWMRTFGVLEAEVCPQGGGIREFLIRNCCPATHILRREAWEKCGGYEETMRSGFEDWEFFLSILETASDARIGIVKEPLINYRTAAASSNVRSMEKRLELMKFIMEKHIQSYQTYVIDAVLGMEAVSMSRLYNWESEICHTLQEKQELSRASRDFLDSPSYGDGGMASAVRIASSGIERIRTI